MKKIFVCLALSVLSACGKIEKNEVTASPIHEIDQSTRPSTDPAQLVPSLAELSPCTEKLTSLLVYVYSEKVFKYCDGTTWNNIDIGASSGGTIIDSMIVCKMQIGQDQLIAAGLDQAPEGGILFDYKLTSFTGGTRFVESKITSGSYSYSGSVFWKAGLEGYTNGMSEPLAFDVMGAKDFGFWYFLIDSKVTGDEKNPVAVIYSDAASGLTDSKVIAFDVASECPPKAQ